jgi:hypothetical protein
MHGSLSVPRSKSAVCRNRRVATSQGETEMRMSFRTGMALTALLTSMLPAAADDVPTLDVTPVCRGIASQAGNPSEKGGPDLSFKDCIASEGEVRGQLAKAWSSFSAADKGHCVRLANTGGESSYTELITCLEMSRDVRQLQSNSGKKVD